MSTKDKRQDVENQLAQLREFCERQGYVIHDEYMDDESGTKGKRERDGFARLFEDAGKRKFDVVLVWSLDRFTREGIQKTIFYLQQLDALGVNFKSYTEQYPLWSIERTISFSCLRTKKHVHVEDSAVAYFEGLRGR